MGERLCGKRSQIEWILLCKQLLADKNLSAARVREKNPTGKIRVNKFPSEKF